MLQLVLLIWGIVILTKQRVSLTRSKVVTGGPAILIGILFVCLMPIGILVGVVLGMVIVANNLPQDNLYMYGLIADLTLIALAVIIAFVIANIYGHDPNEVFDPMKQMGYEAFSPNEPMPPSDPNNPYSSPPR